jgi:hypothetical protein
VQSPSTPGDDVVIVGSVQGSATKAAGKGSAKEANMRCVKIEGTK